MIESAYKNHRETEQRQGDAQIGQWNQPGKTLPTHTQGGY